VAGWLVSWLVQSGDHWNWDRACDSTTYSRAMECNPLSTISIPPIPFADSNRGEWSFPRIPSPSTCIRTARGGFPEGRDGGKDHHLGLTADSSSPMLSYYLQQG